MMMLPFILLLAVTTTELTVISVPPRGNLSLPLSPSGKADLERVGTVSRVRIEIERVPPPTSHGAALNTYVVWTASPEGTLENIGALELNNGRGRLEATTKFEQLGIFITAEPHYMVDMPNSIVVFRNQDPRTTDVRRVTVPITVGAYDYSKIQLPPQGALPGVVIQSRAAFQIARDSDTERLAQPEFRQARVALDTMEEMLTRRMPSDIIEFSAHEAIRRAQQAVAAARERLLTAALDSAKNEVAAISLEKTELEGRVQQLSQQLIDQQAAADAQTRRLQADLTAGSQERQRLALEVDQATARLRGVESDLSGLQRKQAELENSLSFAVRPEFFDSKKALTPEGRIALIRISGIAEFMPSSQIRIEGPFADAALESAVRGFLISTGVSGDRIILIRK
jgi:hypothetical protein